MAEGLSPLPLFQPFLRVRKPVRKQRNTAQPEDSRISLGILVGYSHVDFTSFGKLPNLEPPIARINAAARAPRAAARPPHRQAMNSPRSQVINQHKRFFPRFCVIRARPYQD